MRRSLESAMARMHACRLPPQVRTVEEQDASYTFEMMPRPDTEWDGSAKACPECVRHTAHARTWRACSSVSPCPLAPPSTRVPPAPARSEARAEFVACGLRKRNVGAFINHSCAPNCFVQPVLDVHHDLRCPKICIFASGAQGAVPDGPCRCTAASGSGPDGAMPLTVLVGPLPRRSVQTTSRRSQS